MQAPSREVSRVGGRSLWTVPASWSPWLVDGILAIALMIAGFAQLLERGPGRGAGGAISTPGSHFVLLGLAAGAIILRSRAPLASLALVVLFGAPYWLLDPRQLALLPVALVAVYSVVAGSSLSRPQAWLAAGAGAALLIAGLFIGGPPQPGALEATSAMAILAAILFGDSTRSRRALTLEAERRAEEAERTADERALRRVSEERLEIARELHDIVAHNIMLMNVQAGVAAHLARRDPSKVQETFENIRRVSHQTLEEMRALVGVLREPVAGVPNAPTAGLDGLGELIANAQAAGVPVELSMVGEERRMPATVDVSAYRIVQEALTNAVRYGDGSRIDVRIEYAPTTLRLAVTNASSASPGRAPATSGHGIEGMRERAQALGGTLRAGRTAAGTFEVIADLPLTGASA